MLDDRKISQIAKRVATANLSSQNFTSVTSSSTTDSAGNEALQITIVIKPGAESKITGDAALKTLVEMQHKLHSAGEDRFPIIEYATKKELAESGDS
jgi:outer membrane protein assembly factor BamA